MPDHSPNFLVCRFWLHRYCQASLPQTALSVRRSALAIGGRGFRSHAACWFKADACAADFAEPPRAINLFTFSRGKARRLISFPDAEDAEKWHRGQVYCSSGIHFCFNFAAIGHAWQAGHDTSNASTVGSRRLAIHYVLRALPAVSSYIPRPVTEGVVRVRSQSGKGAPSR
jgi:hypothetical protein